MKTVEEVLEFLNKEEQQLTKEFNEIDRLEEKTTLKVLNAFKNNNVSEGAFNSTTGYGYNDYGRASIG